MNFIKNLKIRDQLLTLLFLLLIPLIFFVIREIKEEIDKNREYNHLMVDLTESEMISDFIHEFQKERARTIAATEGDSALLLEAIAQKEQVDTEMKLLTRFIAENNRSFPGIAMLNDLRRYRSLLDRGKLDQSEFRDYSREVIFNFLDRIDENATGINDILISRRLESFKHLDEAKVHLGRIRTLMMRAFRTGYLNQKEYALIVSRKDFFDQALKSFKRYASEEALEDVQQITASESFKEITGTIQNLENNPRADISSLNPAHIFLLFSTSMEDFKQAEERLISRVKADVLAGSQQNQQNLIILIVFLLLTLGLAALLSLYIINLISSSLAALKVAADRIKMGDTDVHIDIEGKNEIGVVADSFRGVVQKNQSLTHVAESIGNGNYDVEVAIQGPGDSLSFAILEMKEKLRRFTSENQRRNWILSGVSDLNNLITGHHQIKDISQDLISFICRYSDSPAGVFYLHDDAGSLVPSATYGVEFNKDQLAAFPIGTGQVGQAVSENTIKILEGIPAEYMVIKTGLAEVIPANIIIIPLEFSDTIVGAMEICSRYPFSPQQQEFLKTAGERISIVLHSLKAHVKTQELLYETQNQAEELETQQEELRELNAELKASEEELKVSQEELQEKNAELEEKAQLLEEQYEALRTKNNALEEARDAIEIKIQQVESVSKYKSEFLANMSHELRTPLNSILILSRLLADNPERNLNDKQAEHARIIHRSGSDLLKLINEILDLSKIESGMIKLEPESINLKSIDLESTFKELALNKAIDFSIHHNTNGLERIITDRFRLEQILKNFLSNAIKFTDKGGKVELSINRLKERPGFLSDELNKSKEVVAFSVKDTGIGIPKEQQKAIFEAFQQADSSTTRKYGGTGLGLAISRELALLLGGEIRLESQEGVGSTFTLFLPESTPQVKEKAPAQQEVKTETISLFKPSPPTEQKQESVSTVFDKLAENGRNKEVSVLIIEDDKAFNDILADFAVAKNFNVYQALTGNEGLELAREMKPDAIMLDIHLPDISGWDVLQEIREDSKLRHVNVHVMSAYDKEVVGQESTNEDYLPKPVTLEMLNTAFSTISALSDSSIETILIVEDNEVENNAIAELLMAHSLKSLSAYSAEEAEKLLARNKVDCIILDLNLPGMKGYEWMGKIRATKGLSEIPIIIYSGKDLSEEEEIKLKKFANTIIIKNEYSYLRLLDEVQLFLHKVNQKLPEGNDFKMKLHVPEEILQNKKVLLVDDDIRNVYSLSNLLELEGMNIIEAYNGKEALNKLQAEESVDIVLMDVMMPEMDGMEAMRAIRKMDKFKNLPVIALTAKAMKEDKEKCIQAGASDYIPKPVDTDKLLTLMRIWLYEA